MEKAVCRCGRDYFPKQAWIHNPCCYVDEVAVNHVRPENRGFVNRSLTVNSPVIKRWGDVNKSLDEVLPDDHASNADESKAKEAGVVGKADRKEYMKQKMREYRARKRAGV